MIMDPLRMYWSPLLPIKINHKDTLFLSMGIPQLTEQTFKKFRDILWNSILKHAHKNRKKMYAILNNLKSRPEPITCVQVCHVQPLMNICKKLIIITK